MKHILFAFILLLFGTAVIAQSDFRQSPIKHTDFKLTGGTTFAAGSGFYGNSLFLAPSLSRTITRKFSLQAGTVFQTYHLFSSSNNELKAFFPAYSLSFFGMGTLQMTEKISVYGGILHTRPFSEKQGDDRFSPGNTFFGGIDYRINSKSTIGLRFAYSKDQTYLLHSPSSFGQSTSLLFPENNFPFGF